MPNPHDTIETHSAKGVSSTQLLRTGMLTLFAISAHNLPEGLATFFAALEEPCFGVRHWRWQIAIHNVRKGVAIALPGTYGHGP